MSTIAATLVSGRYQPTTQVPASNYGVSATANNYLAAEDADVFATSGSDPFVLAGLVSIIYNNPANATPIPASFFGSHSSDPRARNVQIAHGVERLHDTTGCRWNAVNTANGVYNWATLDAIVNQVFAEGKKIVYTFIATPDWAVTGAAVGNAAYGGKSNMNPGAGFLTAFASALAARYAGKITHYECWNEFQDTRYWAGTAAQLAANTRQIYQAVKAADPSAKVISPSCTGWNTGGAAAAAMTSFLAASDGAAGTGATWCGDGVAMHSYNAYPQNGDIAQVHMRHANCRTVMTAAGLATSVPMFDTEWGFNGVVAGIGVWSWRTLPLEQRKRLLLQQFAGLWAAMAAGSAAPTFSCFYRETGEMGWGVGDTDTADWEYAYNLLTTKPIVLLNYLPVVRRYAIKFADGSTVIA